MANVTYNDHAADTSVIDTDLIPFWDVTAGAVKKATRANLLKDAAEVVAGRTAIPYGTAPASLAATLALLAAGARNVKAYGATGDGTTDDTTTIQAALDAAEASTGVVFFPPGTYKITDTLTVGSNVTVMGAGMGATRINQVTATKSGFIVTSETGVHIRDLYLYGPGTSGSELERGVQFVTCTFCSVTHCKLDNWGQHGIYLYTDACDNTIAHNDISSTSCHNGISLYGGCDRNKITGNTMTSCEDQGIEIRRSSHNTVTNNVINTTVSATPGHGIGLEEEANHNTITGNTMIDCVGAGVGLTMAHENTISGNTIKGCGYGVFGATGGYKGTYNVALAIASIIGDGGTTVTVDTTAAHGLLDGAEVSIAGTTNFNGGPFVVTVTDTDTFTYTDAVGGAVTTAETTGTVTREAGRANVVTGNQVRNSTSVGIRFAQVEKAIVTGNTVIGGGSTGIYAEGTYSYGVRICDNYVHRNTGRGIYVNTAGRCTVANNYVSKNGLHGIALSGSSYNTVNGNTVYDNGTASSNQDGISLTSASTHNTIANNITNDVQATATQRYGISIASGCTYNVAIGNHTIGNTNDGIDNQGGVTGIVEHNMVA